MSRGHDPPGVDDFEGGPDAGGRFQAERLGSRHEPGQEEPGYGPILQAAEDFGQYVRGCRAWAGKRPDQPLWVADAVQFGIGQRGAQRLGVLISEGEPALLGAAELASARRLLLAGEWECWSAPPERRWESLSSSASGAEAGFAVASGSGVSSSNAGVAAASLGVGASVGLGSGVAVVQAVKAARITSKAMVARMDGFSKFMLLFRRGPTSILTPALPVLPSPSVSSHIRCPRGRVSPIP